MAFRTQILSRTFRDATNLARSIHGFATSKKASMVAGAVSWSLIRQTYETMVDASAQFNAAKDVSGIGPFAKDQHNDQDYNVGTEFAALIAAVDAVVTQIEADIPASGGWIQVSKFEASAVVDRTFSSGATSTLQTKLQAVLDAIDMTQ